mgnify:CR=1 FL=1
MKDTDWKILYELYMTPNITKVAEKLFIAQPTLTKRLQYIEEEFQTRILIRSNKGVQFTKEGEFLMHQAELYLQFRSGIDRRIESFKQEGIGTSYIDIVLAFGIKAVDRQLKLRTHLNFVNKKVISFTCCIMLLRIRMESVVFLNFFKFQIHEINEDDIDIPAICFQVFHICLHQLGLTRTPDTSNNLNIRRTIQLNNSIEVFFSHNRFHILTHFQKLIFF